VSVEPGEIYVDRNGRLGRRRVQRVLITTVLLLVIAFSIGWFITPARRVVTPTAQAISTKTGERKTYILPDGSEVILNSNSSISFENNLGGKERRIQLTGEAFFNVAKDATRPFIVSSNDFSTTALGTAFMVDARHANKNYRVSLLEGKVKINGNNTSSMLVAGERVDWIGENKTFTRSTFDTLQLKAWLAGDLRLKRLDAATAFSILEDWYAVNIIDQRVVKSDLIVSGNFSNENLNDVLKVICFSLSCQYEINNDTVTIK
jgi:ferric-dicitrate binding protein FerR (iron transport regulator)